MEYKKRVLLAIADLDSPKASNIGLLLKNKILSIQSCSENIFSKLNLKVRQ